MIRLRVIAIPDGEAPAWIRQSWVGLDLPSLSDRPETIATHGVAAAGQPLFHLLTRLGLRRPTLRTGYRVPSDVAIGLLAGHAPKAAEWWRDTLPWTCQPGSILLFNAAAVEVVPPTR